MLEEDSLPAANRQKNNFTDNQVTHYWDPERIFGNLLSRILKIKISIAWDVYLLYPPSHFWTSELPLPPKFWMHQLDGEDPALFLDADQLTRTVKSMVKGIGNE